MQGLIGNTRRRLYQFRLSKCRYIGADGKLNDQLTSMRRVVIVQTEPFPDLAGSNSDDRIRVGIIGGSPAKNFDPDAALFQLGCITQKSLLNHIGQQGRVALAVYK